MTQHQQETTKTKAVEDKLINWDDWKCFLAIRLDRFPGRPVIETIEPLYTALIERIKAGEIQAFSRTGKVPHGAGRDMILTDDEVELFDDGTYLRFGDIVSTFDGLDAEKKGIIAEKLAERFYAEKAKRSPVENGEEK